MMLLLFLLSFAGTLLVLLWREASSLERTLAEDYDSAEDFQTQLLHAVKLHLNGVEGVLERVRHSAAQEAVNAERERAEKARLEEVSSRAVDDLLASLNHGDSELLRATTLEGGAGGKSRSMDLFSARSVRSVRPGKEADVAVGDHSSDEMKPAFVIDGVAKIADDRAADKAKKKQMIGFVVNSRKGSGQSGQTIVKTYEHFQALHQQLLKLSDVSLPSLPNEKTFRKNSSKDLEKQQKYLQKYINALPSNVFSLPMVREFFTGESALRAPARQALLSSCPPSTSSPHKDASVVPGASKVHLTANKPPAAQGRTPLAKELPRSQSFQHESEAKLASDLPPKPETASPSRFPSSPGRSLTPPPMSSSSEVLPVLQAEGKEAARPSPKQGHRRTISSPGKVVELPTVPKRTMPPNKPKSSSPPPLTKAQSEVCFPPLERKEPQQPQAEEETIVDDVAFVNISGGSQQGPDKYEVLEILKKCVGMDILRIRLPMRMYEPQTLLQKMCESLKYWSLLTTASTFEHSVPRLAYVAAFAISICSQVAKMKKVFSPLLGETFEYVDDTGNFKFIAEQVSIFPHVAACHAETDDFVFWQTCTIKSKITSTGMVEMRPQGRVHVLLKQCGHEFTWKMPKMTVHNVVEQFASAQCLGTMEVLNYKTKEKVDVRFLQSTVTTSPELPADTRRDVLGAVTSSEKGPFRSVRVWIRGQWDKKLSSNIDLRDWPTSNEYKAMLKGKKKTTTPKDADCLIWQNVTHQAAQGGEDAVSSSTAVQLSTAMVNRPEDLTELTEFQQSILPPSDSRWRLDVAALGRGEEEKAMVMNLGLEDRQMEIHKSRLRRKEVWAPQYFAYKTHKQSKEKEWQFGNGYWVQRRQNVLMWRQSVQRKASKDKKADAASSSEGQQAEQGGEESASEQQRRQQREKLLTSAGLSLFELESPAKTKFQMSGELLDGASPMPNRRSGGFWGEGAGAEEDAAVGTGSDDARAGGSSESEQRREESESGSGPDEQSEDQGDEDGPRSALEAERDASGWPRAKRRLPLSFADHGGDEGGESAQSGSDGVEASEEERESGKEGKRRTRATGDTAM